MMRSFIRKLARRIKRRQNTTTVRFAFPALVVVSAALAAVLSSSVTDQSYVRIETTPKSVVAGDDITISVYAHAAVPTNAVDIRVSYPERQLSIDRIDVGESVITIWTEEPRAQDGIISMRGGVFRRGFLGEHLIARIHARANETGQAHILTSQTQFVAGDGKGSVVEVARTGAEDATIVVSRAGELKSAVSVGIVTDIDGDGDVDMSDIMEFLAAWRADRSVFDFNGDGKMTFRDFGILLAHSFWR